MATEILSPRERVSLALSHQETDRIPFDFGGRISGIALSTYEQLKHLIGYKKPTKVLDVRLQIAEVPEELLQRFRVDTRYVYMNSAKSWDPQWRDGGSVYVDEWGIWLARPEGSYYYDYIKAPLSDLNTIEELEKYSWPDPDDLSRIEGKEEEARTVSRDSFFFTITTFKGTFEQAWALRGLEQFLMDLILNREYVEALLDKVFEVQKKIYGPFLQRISPYLDMVCFTDDMGGQEGPLISPQIYRDLIKPRHKKMFDFLREKTGAVVALHSCGSVAKFLTDFVDVGIEVINPVQVTAKDMSIDRLKEEWGDNLSFWGAIDTQNLLPFGKPEDVSDSIRRTCAVLSKGGGYLYAPVHNIQTFTPAENVLNLLKGPLT